MKIFPLRPMSTFDRIQNVLKIMEDYQSVSNYASSCPKLEVISGIDKKNSSKDSLLKSIISKLHIQVNKKTKI